jgi:anti-anti-sigma factor
VTQLEAVPAPEPTSATPRPRLTVTRTADVVAIAGEVDVGNALQLRAQLHRGLHAGAVRVDLTGLTLLSSAGIAVLFEMLDDSESMLEVTVRSGSAVAQVIEICGLSTVARVIAAPDPGGPRGCTLRAEATRWLQTRRQVPKGPRR